MNLGIMAIGCLLIGMVALERGAKQDGRYDDTGLLTYIGALAIVVMMMRGFYWNIFGRRHGFFTANRSSALAIYLALLFLPELLRLARKLRR